MKRLLLDQGIPRGALQILRDAGVDAVHVAEIGMSTARDETILEFARQHSRSIITLDADFHTLLAVSGAAGPSVLRIRQEGLRGGAVAALVLEVLDTIADQWERGAMVTVDRQVIRTHRLPVERGE